MGLAAVPAAVSISLLTPSWGSLWSAAVPAAVGRAEFVTPWFVVVGTVVGVTRCEGDEWTPGGTPGLHGGPPSFEGEEPPRRDAGATVRDAGAAKRDDALPYGQSSGDGTSPAFTGFSSM